MLGNGRKSPTGFNCPSCVKKLLWKKLGEWEGGIFGFLFCSSHRYPVVWGIPIFLKQPPIPFLLSLIESRRFEESMELVLASSFPKTIGHFQRRREWASTIVSNRKTSFKMALSPFPKSWQRFFHGRLRDPSFHRLRSLAQTMLPSDIQSPRRGSNPTRALLDLGCGTAPLAYALNGRVSQARITSLDINFYLLYFARRFFQSQSIYVCADARERLPFPTGSFGGIICCGVSEAIQDQGRFLGECERLLSPSGFFCWQP